MAPTSEARTLELARTDRRNLFDAPRFRAGINVAGFDAVVAFSGPNVTYTGGIVSRGDETPEACLTTADGHQVLIAAQDYAMFYDACAWVSDVRGYPHQPDALGATIELLVQALVDAGLERARIGLEMPVQTQAIATLTERLPAATLGDATPVFARIRSIKTLGEIDLYRVAARHTSLALSQAWNLSRTGDSEKLLSARVQARGLELGAEFSSHCQLQAGVHSTIGMAPSLDRPTLAGEIVHIDYGGRFAGYVTDIARNAVIGQAEAAQTDTYSRLADVQHALVEHLRPGVRAGELWQVGTASCARVGLTHPWNTFGHEIGLEIHEGVSLSEGSQETIEPGMLVNLEPSHFAPEGRYHIEDTFLITETGNTNLSGDPGSFEMAVISA